MPQESVDRRSFIKTTAAGAALAGAFAAPAPAKVLGANERIRIGFIEGARNRPEEFQKRLRYFIKMTEKNKQYGFGGIEKHY